MGTVGLVSGDILAGGGTILMGAALVPRLRRIGSLPLTPWVRGGIVIAGFFLLSVGASEKNVPPSPEPDPAIVKATTASSTVSASVQEQANADAGAQALQSITVTAITDGDTIRVRFTSGMEEKIRIIGIDAPESSPVECFAKESAAKLSSLIEGKQVTLEAQSGDDRDSFGRLLRYVSRDGEDIGASLIREGYVYSYEKYPHSRLASYEALETAAKQERKGLWSVCAAPQGTTASKPPAPTPMPTVTPQPTPAPQPTQQTPSSPSSNEDECVIKGNISSKQEKIYHVPGCGSYNQTKINEAAGERWFCSEQEAVDAGWRKAKNYK